MPSRKPLTDGRATITQSGQDYKPNHCYYNEQGSFQLSVQHGNASGIMKLGSESQIGLQSDTFHQLEH